MSTPVPKILYEVVSPIDKDLCWLTSTSNIRDYQKQKPIGQERPTIWVVRPSKMKNRENNPRPPRPHCQLIKGQQKGQEGNAEGNESDSQNKYNWSLQHYQRNSPHQCCICHSALLSFLQLLPSLLHWFFDPFPQKELPLKKLPCMTALWSKWICWISLNTKEY